MQLIKRVTVYENTLGNFDHTEMSTIVSKSEKYI